MAIGLITYQDASRREDLINVVSNISPDKTPLLSGLPMGLSAKQTLHEYPVDSFASSADNAADEGADFTTVDHVQPTRASNNTQIFRDDIRISETEKVVDGVVNAKSYQINKNLKEHAKDIELAFMAGSRASGSSGADGTNARRMTGVINAITTNATTMASNSTLTETIFNDLLELTYESTDEVATHIYTGSKLKRAISGFTGGSTKNVESNSKRLTNSVDIYESDFGVHEVRLHRDVPSSAAGRTIVGINPEYVRKSWLRPTKITPISKAGDNDRTMIVTEGTLEHRGEATGFVANRFQS